MSYLTELQQVFSLFFCFSVIDPIGYQGVCPISYRDRMNMANTSSLDITASSVKKMFLITLHAMMMTPAIHFWRRTNL